MIRKEKYARDAQGRKPWEAEGIAYSTWWTREKRGQRPRAEFLDFVRGFRSSVEGGLLHVQEVRRETEETQAAYDLMKSKRFAGVEFTLKSIQAELGCSNTPVRAAAMKLKTEEGLLSDLASESDQLKAARVLAGEREKMKAELTVQLREELRKEVEDLYNETVLPRLGKEVADARRVMERWKGIFSRQEFKLLLACLHPDKSASPERMAESFRLVKEKEALLSAPPPPEKTDSGKPKPPPLPKTFAEMVAMRKATRQ